jgi:hypothetical protein
VQNPEFKFCHKEMNYSAENTIIKNKIELKSVNSNPQLETSSGSALECPSDILKPKTLNQNP